MHRSNADCKGSANINTDRNSGYYANHCYSTYRNAYSRKSGITTYANLYAYYASHARSYPYGDADTATHKHT